VYVENFFQSHITNHKAFLYCNGFQNEISMQCTMHVRVNFKRFLFEFQRPQLKILITTLVLTYFPIPFYFAFVGNVRILWVNAEKNVVLLWGIKYCNFDHCFRASHDFNNFNDLGSDVWSGNHPKKCIFYKIRERIFRMYAMRALFCRLLFHKLKKLGCRSSSILIWSWMVISWE